MRIVFVSSSFLADIIAPGTSQLERSPMDKVLRSRIWSPPSGNATPVINFASSE
jgi:hypothetical protein